MTNGSTFRYLDRDGRLGIPKYFRVMLNWTMGDELQLELHNGCVMISKHADYCAVCGSNEHLYSCGKKQFLCADCIEEAWKTKCSYY